MGFIIKSTFWLGIVYSAMPLGQVAPFDPAAEVGDFLCGPAGAAVANGLAREEAASYRLGVAAACAAVARAPLGGAPTVEARPNSDGGAVAARGSAQSLTDADRKPPWMGGERRASTDEAKQGWRATRPSGYKRVAVTHPERHAVDD